MSIAKSPVEKLAEILLTEFQRDELEPELTKYKGDYSTRVLEFCLDRDPGDILAKLFGLPRLRKVAKNLNIQVRMAAANASDLVPLMLQSLGFNISPEFLGIKQAVSKAEECQHNFSICGDKEKIGLMTELYNEVERVLRDIFLFYFRIIYSEDYQKDSNINNLMKEKLRIEKPIDKMGLGDFISGLRSLNATLRSNPDLKKKMTDAFQKPYVISKASFKILDDISKYRKFFVHYKGKIPSDSECEAVITNIRILLGEFTETTTYPDLVRVNEVVVNKYGIRCIRAEDEFGGLWKIYTDEVLEANKLYFVFSKSGQVAIRPLLLEKTDIESRENLT